MITNVLQPQPGIKRMQSMKPYTTAQDEEEILKKLIQEELARDKEEQRLKQEAIIKQKEEELAKLRQEQGVGAFGPLETSNKISKMIEEIKRRKAAAPIAPVEQMPIPLVSPDLVQPENAVYCPTCGDHNGHKHEMSLQPDGFTFKCTGPNCDTEKILLDTNSDYRCKDCGMPLPRKEMEQKHIVTCPTCFGKKAELYPWKKKIEELRKLHVRK